MHLDMIVDDLDTAETAALDLGTTRHPDQPGTSYRVFLDPGRPPLLTSPAVIRTCASAQHSRSSAEERVLEARLSAGGCGVVDRGSVADARVLAQLASCRDRLVGGRCSSRPNLTDRCFSSGRRPRGESRR
jgi:hypothetical protein